MEIVVATAIWFDGWWPWLLLGVSGIGGLLLLIVNRLGAKSAAIREARRALRARLGA